jgi:hypothetical protein
VYNRNPYKTKAIGYLHLSLAVLSTVYLLMSLFVPIENLTPTQIIQQKYSRYALLFCIVVDIIIGTYINTEQNKVFLFFQALASMILFTAHIFFVYAYFTADGLGVIDIEVSLDIAMIFVVIATALHAINLLPQTDDDEENDYKIKVSDDLFDFTPSN